MRFRPEQHLRRQDDFRAVRSLGRRVECGIFTLWWRRGGESTRVGLVASRAAVGGAVQRNRAKRRLREVFRRNQKLVPPGLDLILIARAAVFRREFRDVEQGFVEACGKLGGSA